MAKRLQHRGGTTSQHSTFTGAVREVTVDTDKNTLVVHDGATAGGHPLATATNFTSTGIDDNATSTAITIDSSGNVGIGTSSPARELDVDGRGIFRDDLSITRTSSLTKLSITASGVANFDLGFNNSGATTQGISNNAGFLSTRQSFPIIFATAEAERMRIDSSGNVLIGKTSALTANVGIQLTQPGTASFTSDNAVPLIANRKTTDGDIIVVRTDNSTVGSIGVEGGDSLFITCGDTGLRFSKGQDAIIPATTNGAIRDNAINLGIDSVRYKDLYLSGGLYVGGTGTANKLDDYEEGTHTATMSTTSGSVTLSSTRDGMRYIKVGNMVHLTGEVTVSTVSSPVSPRLSLPFVIASWTNDRNTNFGGYVKTYSIAFNADNQAVSYHGGAGNSYVNLSYSTNNGAFGAYTPQAGDTYFFNIVYFTDA